jgi:YegS/Rv2252/BmrU family lipid kinase
MPRSATLIYNPGSGPPRGRGLAMARIADALRGRGLRVTVTATTGPGEASRLAREAAEAGAECVVVNGGDGTVNEAMQGLVGGTTPLGVWPGGTANVLARELGLPHEPDALADMLAAGRTRRVSVGQAGERYFLLMAGIGLDAAVVRDVSPAFKRFTGEGAYWLAGFKQLTDWRPTRFVVEVDGQVHTATFAVVANAASYGGGFRFAPLARMDDELLDLCLFDSDRRHQFARYLAAARSGAHLSLPGVTYLRSRQAAVHGGEDQYVQVDGELLGPLPVTFKSVPAALSLIVP